ncbi:single-strand selective monofunctional uracil DNA glycosylase [Musca domestica]|uniref:Single-strand selective monofunctional uracil DNA glycosylase n=1 Tax=Musca domestica TaxID=7370 RepID=A0A1I8N831_MUSDO|nr:single-strand selective monofunctional uracil DNA glycosylase [Musca domestica]
MLKKKLQYKITANPTPNNSHNVVDANSNERNLPLKVSPFFVPSYWELFYALECQLNGYLRLLKAPVELTHIYNPVEYAAQIHCDYLKRYLKGPMKVLFIGMNPGGDGMAQNGIPFGNISTVRDSMQLQGVIVDPPQQHPKRPIQGFECTREEPSGKRLWTLFQKLANNSLETFFQQCFVHNFCPLAFFDAQGRNITPSEIKGPYKKELQDTCLRAMEQQLHILQPDFIIAVGDYVFKALRNSEYCRGKRLLRLDHPSPRSLNNTNWPEKAETFLRENDLLKYLRNEVAAGHM